MLHSVWNEIIWLAIMHGGNSDYRKSFEEVASELSVVFLKKQNKTKTVWQRLVAIKSSHIAHSKQN